MVSTRPPRRSDTNAHTIGVTMGNMDDSTPRDFVLDS